MGRSYLKKAVFGLIFGVAIAAFIVVGTNVLDVGAQGKKKVDHMKAWKIYTAKCLSCHDSVADPEKPGMTRDDWHIIVNVMHGYGLGITDEEGNLITDLLYDLRRGIEREAG
jgi:hypothetical protein